MIVARPACALELNRTRCGDAPLFQHTGDFAGAVTLRAKLENQLYYRGRFFVYQEGSEVCTAHYIRECVLDEVVLEDLRRVTAMAREHAKEFAEYIGGRQSAEIQREIRRLERELTSMRKCGAELDTIFKRLYEDRVLGHLSVEQFQTLSGGYTEEQAKLTEEIPAKEEAIQKLRDTVSSTDGFIAKAKRYTDITKLTPELLRLFIQKIVVHEKSTKWSKKAMQTIKIHYNDIGRVGGDIQQDEESPRQEISV